MIEGETVAADLLPDLVATTGKNMVAITMVSPGTITGRSPEATIVAVMTETTTASPATIMANQKHVMAILRKGDPQAVLG